MPLKRWITGLAALPFLIYLIVVGGFAFFGLVASVALLALWEYYRILFKASTDSATDPIPLAGFFTVPLIIFGAHMGSQASVMGFLALNLVVVALISLIRFDPERPGTESIFIQVLGVVYIAVPLALLVLIRGEAQGITWVIFILAIVFVGDTCAFHVGSHFGRHKLCPAISPGKTVEGAAGGLAGNLVAGGVVKLFFLPDLPWGWGLAFFIFVGLAGQVGDLFESRFKRLGKIKDSGAVLPGHGGILDRIDALLFAAPVAYLFKHVVL